MPSRGAFRRVIADANLLRLNYGIFALHALLMALFVEVPFALRDNGIAATRHWEVYLPVLVAVGRADVAVCARGRPAAARQAGVHRRRRRAAGCAGGARVRSPFAAGASPALALFFAAFNLLEATLPSLVSRYAPSDLKGSALGVYSSVQFLGAFAGAAIGGWLAQHVRRGRRVRLRRRAHGRVARRQR